MDIFYRAPSQLKQSSNLPLHTSYRQQCDSLESNYLNCLLQKSIKDNVIRNYCILDNILWFHLQCPRRIQRYEDESYIRRKVKGMYNYQKQELQRLLLLRREHQKSQFQSSIYPTDIEYNPDLQPSDRVDPLKAARHKALSYKKIQVQDDEKIRKNMDNLPDHQYNKHFWVPRNFNEKQ